MTRNIKVGLVGIGEWGRKHADVFSRVPGCTLHAIVDTSEERLTAARACFPSAEVGRDWRDLFSRPELDAVVVATPAGTHFSIAEAALRAGKHVLVEKPFAPSVPLARTLCELARSARRIVMAGHTYLYHPSLPALFGMIGGDELGEVSYIMSQRLNWGRVRSDVDVWWNLGPHDVSLLVHRFGVPRSITAYGTDVLRRGLLDAANVSLQWDKLTADLHLSVVHPLKIRRLFLYGSRKLCCFDDLGPRKLELYDARLDSLKVDNGPPPAPPSRELAPAAAGTATPDALFRQATHFAECIRSGREPLSGGEHALAVTGVLEAGAAALRTGKTIFLSGSELRLAS